MISDIQNLFSIKNELKDHNAQLVAVSKTKPIADILEVYNTGHKIFGENYVQELSEKYDQLPKDIEWHFIGHLQRNKVKMIAPFVALIQSVDSISLLTEIDKEGKKNNRVINCLLQIHIAQEETKFGFSFDEAKVFLKSDELKSFSNINIKGLMGMATFTANEKEVRQEYKNLTAFFNEVKNISIPHFNCENLSMGMTSDYKIALEEGSNMVRIGSAIFGERG